MARNTQRKIDESLRRDLEWSCTAMKFGGPNDMNIVKASRCPLCKGINPSDSGRHEFEDRIKGHLPGCDLAPRRTLTGTVIP